MVRDRQIRHRSAQCCLSAILRLGTDAIKYELCQYTQTENVAFEVVLNIDTEEQSLS